MADKTSEISLKHPLIAQLVLDSKWAIKHETFEIILNALKGEGDEKLAAEIRGSKLSNEARYVELLGQGIAVIPIVGPIIPRETFFSAICGIASAEGLMKDFAAAVEDPKVKSIIFDVDSPGGTVTGISELSQMVFEARSKKHVTSYVRGFGASAAYWALSAASKVYVSETAEVGSVGIVFAGQMQDKKEGVQSFEIVSSVSPKKRLSPMSKEGKAAFQAVVDSLADVMVGNIARNRGVSADTVLSDFGEGFVLVGKDAVKMKMADGVSTFEALVTAEMDRQKPKGVFDMTAEAKTYTAAEADALIKSAKEEGRVAGVAEGAKAERERIASIETIKAPGYEAVIIENKMKPEMTKDKVAGLILEAQTARADKAAVAVKTDAEKLAEQTLAAGTGAAPAVTGNDAEKNAVVAAMAAGANARR